MFSGSILDRHQPIVLNGERLMSLQSAYILSPANLANVVDGNLLPISHVAHSTFTTQLKWITPVPAITTLVGVALPTHIPICMLWWGEVTGYEVVVARHQYTSMIEAVCRCGEGSE